VGSAVGFIIFQVCAILAVLALLWFVARDDKKSRQEREEEA